MSEELLNEALKADNIGDHKFEEGDIYIVSCVGKGMKMILRNGEWIEYEDHE